MTWREHVAAVLVAVILLGTIAAVIIRPIAVNLAGVEFRAGLSAEPMPREFASQLRTTARAKVPNLPVRKPH
jgi:hypothetical protein